MNNQTLIDKSLRLRISDKQTLLIHAIIIGCLKPDECVKFVLIEAQSSIWQKKYSPRWVIFLFDIGITAVSLSFAYLLRFNFDIPQVDLDSLSFVIPTVLGFRATTFIVFRTFAGIVRYTGTSDAVRIFLVSLFGSSLLAIGSVIKYYAIDGVFILPYSVLIIEFFITTFIMIAMRIAVKVMYLEWKNPSKRNTQAVIIGSGEVALALKRALERDSSSQLKIAGFLELVNSPAGKKIEGIPIIDITKYAELAEQAKLQTVIIADPDISIHNKRQVINISLEHNVQILNVPPINQWWNGEVGLGQLKQVNIDDLLGRDPITLDEEHINNYVNGRTILITGAAGSIGSEIVRQVMRFGPKKVIALDQAESPLYELDLEIRGMLSTVTFETVIGDVRSIERMTKTFETFQPDLVYHAAAYKHVPLMEENPSEAIRTNVWGTQVVADLSVKFEVDRFIMISTDKAVNPTNVMGASKRCAEIYVQALQEKSKTCFITTRFGNVLGSNGSVIPLFQRQIAQGGPVTVTHEDVTRYFMTIPEACQLVLQAGSLGEGGEVFVFDMGESVKIADLARKMIRLAGLREGQEIAIKFTGLRPGEKLYEELLSDEENTLPTPHPQIMIAKVRPQVIEVVAPQIAHIVASYSNQNNKQLVQLMKTLIPEFISKNSDFSQLDVA